MNNFTQEVSKYLALSTNWGHYVTNILTVFTYIGRIYNNLNVRV